MNLVQTGILRGYMGFRIKVGGPEVKGLAHELQESYSAWT